MRKKVLSLVLAMIMVIAMLPTVAFAADYTDTQGHWAEAQIDRWSEYGVVQGSNGSFDPDGNMTRAQAAQVFVNLLKLTETADITAFTDVQTGSWYADAVSKVVAKGIMNGMSATTMVPDGSLSREMMFVMIGRALGIKPAETSTKTFVDGAQVDDWAAGYVNALVNMGAIKGTGNNKLNPTADINRASVMSALDQLIGGYANEDGQTVTIVPGKITLVVADEVKVEGTADPDLPIVVAGTAEKVDMEGVEGEATVQVQVSDVAIENAPVGTEIVAAADTTGVTANGIDVSGDADNDVVIPDTTPTTPSGNTGSGTVTPPTPPAKTEETITVIFWAGAGKFSPNACYAGDNTDTGTAGTTKDPGTCDGGDNNFDGSAGNTQVPAEGDFTAYKVTFKVTSGGSAINIDLTQSNNLVPVLEDSTFEGWSLDDPTKNQSICSSYEIKFTTSDSDNEVNFFAVWEKEVENEAVLVKFNANGGYFEAAACYGGENQANGQQSDTSHPGTCDGGYNNAEGSGTDTGKPEDGFDGYNLFIKKGTTLDVSKLTEPKKTGFEFDGWYTTDGKKVTIIKLTADLDLMAHWNEIGS